MKIIVNIDVPELDPAIQFYCAALGLKHVRTLDDDVAELKGASSTIYLVKKEPGSRGVASNERQYSRHWTPVHVDSIVDNISEAAKRASAADAIKESECIEWKCSKCITFVSGRVNIQLPTFFESRPEELDYLFG